MQLTGHCLCGAICFQATSNKGGLYQCHCSLCRRATGSSANANVVVRLENFAWQKPPTTLKHYQQGSWLTAFCSECGAKAPMIDESRGIVYLPAGSLEQDQGLQVVAHIYVGSKASWDEIGGNAEQKPAN